MNSTNVNRKICILKKGAYITGTILAGLLYMSCSKKFSEERTTFTLPVDKTMADLLAGYDTDGDKKITKDDAPQKDYYMVSTQGHTVILRNTYYLSNLLQELAIAHEELKDTIEISLSRIQEPPAERISRRIRTHFWDDLTRTVDEDGLARITEDEKMHDSHRRIYVPYADTTGIEYFLNLQKTKRNLEVVILPPTITGEYVYSINDKPGILSLKIENGKGVPFVVPGGRFNEMYGWDSYFEGKGLILDGRLDLAKAMVDNFCYQVKYYGKILNANRSYYLTRTQPPFLSSFIREVYEATPKEERSKEWLTHSLSMAIKEYEEVWMSGKRYTPDTGLNRYYAGGIGIPPETEPGHFREILQEYADRYNISVLTFEERYKHGEIEDAALDRYFVHDRTLRESGHDTSWRLDNVAADLNCVDLNSLLYKYEKDFEYLIETCYNDSFTAENGETYTATNFREKAATRKIKMKQYCWDAEKGCYFDYNIKTGQLTDFMAATNFFPLWAGLCTQEEANRMVPVLMHDLKAQGGILASSRESTNKYATNNVKRQWDYPNGWAPHQIVLWKGLMDYGFEAEAREMIYRWLWTITQNAVDYNGTIPEKYDVVNSTHKVYAEYGNVGTEFAYITKSGFGWMNASYQYGLSLLPQEYIQKLDNLEHPDTVFGKP